MSLLFFVIILDARKQLTSVYLLKRSNAFKMRGEPTTSELQALAARQQQQLDTQARLIAAREHRLRQVLR